MPARSRRSQKRARGVAAIGSTSLACLATSLACASHPGEPTPALQRDVERDPSASASTTQSASAAAVTPEPALVPDDLTPLPPGPDVPPSSTLRLAFIGRTAAREVVDEPKACPIPGAAFLCGLSQLVIVRDGRAERDLALERGLPHDEAGALSGRVAGLVGRWPNAAWLLLDRLAYRWTDDRWVASDSYLSDDAGFATWNHALVYGDSTGINVVSTGPLPRLPRSALGPPSAVVAFHHELGNGLCVAGNRSDHYASIECWLPGATTARVERVIQFGSVSELIATPDGELFAVGSVGERGVLLRARADRWVDVDLPALSSYISAYARSGSSEWLLAAGQDRRDHIWARVGGGAWDEVTRYASAVQSLGAHRIDSLALVDGTLWLTLVTVEPCGREEGCPERTAIVRTGDVGAVQWMPL